MIEVDGQESNGALIAKVTGEAGSQECDEFERQLRMITTARPGLVVLDLSGLTYISSVALGMMIRLRNDLAGYGGRILLAAMQRPVADAFKFAGLEKIFPIHATVQDALAK